MKRKLNKLHLNKRAVSLLNLSEMQKANAGMAATKPYFTCPITCGPTWLCPPPLDPTTDCV